MGFLSAYEGVRRVPIDHPEKDYWIDLREHISFGEREKAEQALSRIVIRDGVGEVHPDQTTFRQLLVLAHTKSWNIDDDNGTVWPVTLASVRRLPADVFDRIWTVVDELGSPPSRQEQARFPGGGVVGDPDGESGADVAVEVPA